MEMTKVRARKWVDVNVDMNTTGKDLKHGDLYVAKGDEDIGWVLLECEEVDLAHGCVVPTEPEYCYDLHECRKVIKTKVSLETGAKRMRIDGETTSIAFALQMAKKYYPKDKYDHAMRVMQYVADNDMIPYGDKDNCVALAIMHDLIEDTDYRRLKR